MAWHMGYPLSQSIFTSLYVDRLLWPLPRSLEEASFSRLTSSAGESLLVNEALRPYCLGLIKTCDFVYSKISSEHYYEVRPSLKSKVLFNVTKEEDFVLSLYNRSLLGDFDVSEILDSLRKAETSILKFANGSEDLIIKAIATRLKFRLHLLEAVITREIVDWKRANAWEQCLTLLTSIKDTHSLGKEVPESFSSKIQRRLASTVPPRPIAHVEFEDAFDLLGRICRHGKDVYQVLDYEGGLQLQVCRATLELYVQY